MKKTETLTLAYAMDALARDIQTGDGVANAAIAEAAERLRSLELEVGKLTMRFRTLSKTREDEYAAAEGIISEREKTIARLREEKAKPDCCACQGGGIVEHEDGGTVTCSVCHGGGSAPSPYTLAQANRIEILETALRDAVSTYTGADKLVTAERIEAWQAALGSSSA